MMSRFPHWPRLLVPLVVLWGTLWLLPSVRAGDKARQVTICAIIADPSNQTIDPRLAAIGPQLRKLLPNHGFTLVDVKSKRLNSGQSVVCNLGGGLTAEALLVEPLDDNGKVQIKCDLWLNSVSQFSTAVATPPNQLFFCDQKRMNGTHLLIAVGAR